MVQETDGVFIHHPQPVCIAGNYIGDNPGTNGRNNATQLAAGVTQGAADPRLEQLAETMMISGYPEDYRRGSML